MTDSAHVGAAAHHTGQKASNREFGSKCLHTKSQHDVLLAQAYHLETGRVQRLLLLHLGCLMLQAWPLWERHGLHPPLHPLALPSAQALFEQDRPGSLVPGSRGPAAGA